MNSHSRDKCGINIQRELTNRHILNIRRMLKSRKSSIYLNKRNRDSKNHLETQLITYRLNDPKTESIKKKIKNKHLLIETTSKLMSE